MSYFLKLSIPLLLLPISLCAEDHFLEVHLSADQIAKSNFKNNPTPGKEMGFTQANLRGTCNIPCDQCSGFTLIAGAESSHIDWAENPHFTTETFGFINVGAGIYNFHLSRWRIIANIFASFDTESTKNNYILYNGMLWGQYCYPEGWFCDTVLHFGAIGTSGLEQTFILPIIGFSMRPFSCWRLSVVFPMDMSLSYQFHEFTSAYIGLNGLRKRHRIAQDEPLSMGVWQYRNLGTEIGIRYNNCCWLEGNLHVGITWEGDLKVMDTGGNAIQHYKTEGALYAGFTLGVGY